MTAALANNIIVEQSADGYPCMVLPTCVVLQIAEDISETRMNEGAFIDEAALYQIKQVNEHLFGARRYAVLVTTSNFNAISERAREFSASAEFVRNTKGKALLVHNSATKLVGNFDLNFNKPVMPTKLFTDRAKAIAWLKTLK